MTAVLDEIRRVGRGPNIVQLSMAVSRLGKFRGESRAALELLHSMEDTYGVAPNEYTYSAAIAALEKEGRWATAIELLRELESSGLT